MSLRDYLAANPPPDSSFTQSVAGVAERANAGEEFLFAVRELLDEVQLLPRADLVRRALEQRPALTGDPRHDAYLGALAEHLAFEHGVERPAWACEPERFLDRMWFVTDVAGFRATLLVESPAAFRRRGVFVSGRSLRRC